MNGTIVAYRPPQRDPKPWPVDYLERVYKRPRPYLWGEDFARFHGHDLPGLTDGQISLELSNLWRRICLEQPRPDDWLWERRTALFAERDRRRAVGRRVA